MSYYIKYKEAILCELENSEKRSLGSELQNCIANTSNLFLIQLCLLNKKVLKTKSKDGSFQAL